jgi:hypothetical protein
LLNRYLDYADLRGTYSEEELWMAVFHTISNKRVEYYIANSTGVNIFVEYEDITST